MPVCSEMFSFPSSQDSKFSTWFSFPESITLNPTQALEGNPKGPAFSPSHISIDGSFALDGKTEAQFLGSCLREAKKQIYSTENLGSQLQGGRQSVNIPRSFYFSSAFSSTHFTQLPLNNNYLYSLFGPIPDSSSL